jgi:hypothetical protein
MAEAMEDMQRMLAHIFRENAKGSILASIAASKKWNVASACLYHRVPSLGQLIYQELCLAII